MAHCMDKYFDGLFISEAIGFNKPDARYFEYVAENIEGFDPTPYMTTPLIKACTQLLEAPEGYSLKVEIISSTIQAEPTSVVQEQWGVTVANGVLTPN